MFEDDMMVEHDNKWEELSVAESIAHEKNTFALGIKSIGLMEKAGKGLSETIIEIFPQFSKILVLCGTGNNGGDGLVAARYLSKIGKEVSVMLFGRSNEMRTNDGKTNYALFNKIGKSPIWVHSVDELEKIDLQKILQENEIIVDSLIGVGLSGPVRGLVKEVIRQLNINDLTIVSTDVPSGINATTGDIFGDAVKSSLIVTFDKKKTGLSVYSQEKIVVIPIGVPETVRNIIGEGHLVSFWPQRNERSHKGQNGTILIIGGSKTFVGAPALAAKAALRCGADTARMIVPDEIRAIIASYLPDHLSLTVPGDFHSSKNLQLIKEQLTYHDVILIGPGISNTDESSSFCNEFYKIMDTDKPVVIDADAIKSLKGNLSILKEINAILTPHKKEFELAFNKNLPEDEQEKLLMVKQTAKEYSCTILLKGKVDIISNGDKTLTNDSGHAGMTVGGTGDVLAGVVAYLANFVKPLYAAAVGAYLTGLAGEESAKKYGNGLLASDIIDDLSSVLKAHAIGGF
ncbi:MAG: NAD(P)H-hydrate dehydratase [Candidatus Kariarchaeaceae archaeon]